jgi:hypothetical protein
MLGKFECICIQQRLWDYAASRLSRADHQRVAQHLETCAACRNRADREMRLAGYVAIYGEQPVAAPPPAWLELRDAISVAAMRKGVPVPMPRRRLGWLLCGSAVAAGLLTMFALQTHRATDRFHGLRLTRREAYARSGNPQTPKAHSRYENRYKNVARAHPKTVQRRVLSGPILPVPSPHIADRGLVRDIRDGDDLHYLNAGSVAALTRWTAMRPDQIGQLQADIDRGVHGGDDFVCVGMPLLAAQGPQAAIEAYQAYQREKEIVDARLAHRVTLAYKAMPFRDVCSSLRKMTGIDLKANQTVADEKVTLFCDDCALRDVMRQITHVFDFVWVRKGQEGDFAYELLQDVRARIAEEELRNRDRNAAVIALADAMERYRPYLDKKPPQLREAARKAQGDKAQLLWQMAGPAWGGIQCYFNLTGATRDALFNDQEIKFSGNPSLAGTVLDPEMNRALLEASGIQISRTATGSPAMSFVLHSKDSSEPLPMIGTPAADWPEACATIGLQINRPEPGKIVLSGNVGVFLISPDPNLGGGMSSPFTLAKCVGPSATGPENAKWNRALRNLPEFKRVISLSPQHTCPRPDANGGRIEGAGSPPITDMFGSELRSEPHLTAADVWEAVHQQTGMPIVADAYTHLYAPNGLAQNHVSVFDALCHDGDLMGVRWKKEGAFLQGRSLTFYWDKLKEVPERLLAHWQQDAKQKDGMPLQDVLEMAQLPDDQLDAEEVDKGVRECRNLLEWALVGRHSNIRAVARLTAQLTAPQLDQALQVAGISLSDLTPSRQEEWATFLIQGRHIPPQMLPGLRLHLDYAPQGRYVWSPAFPDTMAREQIRDLPVISDKTAEGALAEAQRAYTGAKPEQIQHTSGILAITIFRQTPTGQETVAEFGKPLILFVPTNPTR